MFDRLDTRIAALFLGLLLAVQAVGFGVIRQAIERNARASVSAELDTGERIVERLLAQRSQRLRESAQLLAADFGLREAIATGDQATLADVLENHGARVEAAGMMLLGPDLSLKAASAGMPADMQTLARAQAAGGEAAPPSVTLIDGHARLLVTVPLRAPLVIGWIAMAVPLDRALCDDLYRISGVDASVVARDPAGGWRLLETRHAAAEAEELMTQIDAAAGGGQARIAGMVHQARAMPLGQAGGASIAVLLMRSLDDALAPFRRLQMLLALITLGGLAVAAALGWVTARRITEPLKALTRSAERLGAGRYDEPVASAGRGEIAELARSVEAMRTGIRERDQRISRQAFFDRLTGLPNRLRFGQVLEQALAAPQAREQGVSVLMLDLDRFKHVNDALGHGFGDRLLEEFARRLEQVTLAEHQVVARLSGDEFAVLLPGADPARAVAAAGTLLAAMQSPVRLGEETVDLRAGVGSVSFPADGEDAETLLRRAEVAMYRAKAGRAGHIAYAEGMDGNGEASLSLLSELREAVIRDQLRLFLQPKISVEGGQVRGAEALVRWQHPVRGLLGPAHFIAFAEQTGAIRELTGWMLERSVAAIAGYARDGLALRIALNLSALDLMDAQLPERVARSLATHGVAARSLCLEITESAIMDDPVRAEQTLQALHRLGVTLSIDDFGTGYSSLAYLKRLPVSQLKIDRSFVMAIETDEADIKIVRSTIDLAHNLGLSVVAEGVETEGALARLREFGCDEAQGYLIGRPMPQAEFAGWAARHAAARDARTMPA
jgi:diguanylate cyclase (GGDEF)-like protein